MKKFVTRRQQLGLDPQRPPDKSQKGFGDTVEKFTKMTGIKAAVDAVSKATGKDCGCSKRKDTLNRIFPYDKK